MGINLKEIRPIDVEFYNKYSQDYFKSKNNFKIGYVVKISDNTGWNSGCEGEKGIVSGLGGVDNYCYVVTYNKRQDRYCACGFEEKYLNLLKDDIKSDIKLYKAWEDYLIKNDFNICTTYFEEEYYRYMDANRIVKGKSKNIIYVNFV